MVELINADGQFLSKILWTDESLLTREGCFNYHNSHYYSDTNSRRTRVNSYQHRFKINIWCGILNNKLVGPHYFDGTLNGPMYLDFLVNTLPNLIADVGEDINEVIFQQDGAPAHFSLSQFPFKMDWSCRE